MIKDLTLPLPADFTVLSFSPSVPPKQTETTDTHTVELRAGPGALRARRLTYPLLPQALTAPRIIFKDDLLPYYFSSLQHANLGLDKRQYSLLI